MPIEYNLPWQKRCERARLILAEEVPPVKTTVAKCQKTPGLYSEMPRLFGAARHKF